MMNTQEAADALGLSSKTLRLWRAANKGPCYVKYGGRFFYKPQDLEDWRAGCRVVTPEMAAQESDAVTA